MRLPALLACTAAALLCAGPAAAGAQDLPPDFWAVKSFDAPTVPEVDYMRRSGVGMVRVQFDWRQIEPERPTIFGHRSYRWEKTDAWVEAVAHSGLSIHAMLLGSPRWVASEHLGSPMRTTEGRQSWPLFVRAVAERYGPGGAFWRQRPNLPRHPIRVFQIWNEQNSWARYKPAPNPREYAELLRGAASQIRLVAPGARVVLGGMFGTPQGHESSMTAWDFLRELYEVPGIRSHFDAVGVHPYAPNMRGIRYQMRTMRAVMDAAGDADEPIEVTELGWSSGRNGAFFFFAGRKGQAQNLKRSFKLLLRKRMHWRVERILWLSWRDTQQTEGCGYCEKFGLLDQDLGRKPAYRSFRRFATGEIEVPAR